MRWLVENYRPRTVWRVTFVDGLWTKPYGAETAEQSMYSKANRDSSLTFALVSGTLRKRLFIARKEGDEFRRIWNRVNFFQW